MWCPILSKRTNYERRNVFAIKKEVKIKLENGMDIAVLCGCT